MQRCWSSSDSEWVSARQRNTRSIGRSRAPTPTRSPRFTSARHRGSQAYISLVSRYMLRRNWSSMITSATKRRGGSTFSAQWSKCPRDANATSAPKRFQISWSVCSNLPNQRFRQSSMLGRNMKPSTSSALSISAAAIWKCSICKSIRSSRCRLSISGADSASCASSPARMTCSHCWMRCPVPGSIRAIRSFVCRSRRTSVRISCITRSAPPRWRRRSRRSSSPRTRRRPRP